MTFRALRLFKTETGQETRFVDLTDADLMDGDVDVRVEFSTVNYKDGLALTGRSPVVRKFPMIPGIDFAGTVEESSHPDFKPGDVVVQNGFGLSETHYGGYCELARVKGDRVDRDLPRWQFNPKIPGAASVIGDASTCDQSLGGRAAGVDAGASH